MIPDNAGTTGKATGRTEDLDPEFIAKLLEKHGQDSSALLSILGDVQAKYHHLPADALRIVAEKTGCSLVDVYGAATFYRSFTLEPQGEHVISVCLGTACHVRGAPMVAEEFQRQLGISAGETTPDQEFTLETVNCLGACALGPIVVADGHYFSNVTAAKVKQILQKTLTGLEEADFDQDERIFPMEVGCPHCGQSLMDAEHLIHRHPSIRLATSRDSDHGCVRLSCLYGVCTMQSDHEIAVDTLVQLFCPHCFAALLGPANCLQCNAPMARLAVRGGGVLHLCSRCGCDGHMLDLDGGCTGAADGDIAKPIRGTRARGG